MKTQKNRTSIGQVFLILAGIVIAGIVIGFAIKLVGDTKSLAEQKANEVTASIAGVSMDSFSSYNGATYRKDEMTSLVRSILDRGVTVSVRTGSGSSATTIAYLNGSGTDSANIKYSVSASDFTSASYTCQVNRNADGTVSSISFTAD